MRGIPVKRPRIEWKPSLFQRCGQPGQQQGLRIPSLSSVSTRSMCCLRVFGFLTEIIQHIHSLRASAVISSHLARAAGSEMRTFRKSAGTPCTAPSEIAFLVMDFILLVTWLVWRIRECWRRPGMLERPHVGGYRIWMSAGERRRT